MLRSNQVLLALLACAFLDQVPLAHAVGEVKVDITGCSTITGTANPSFSFNAPCPATNPVLTVNATVTAIGDTVPNTLDILRITGTITANQDVNHAEIKITRVFDDGPVTTSGNVFYKTCAAGTLTQDAGRTNSFTLSGSVANPPPPSGLFRQMGAQIYYSSNQGSSFTCTVGSTTTTGQWTTPPQLTTEDRTLQADLFVSIKQGGVMNLSGVNYIKIQSQGSADDIPVPLGNTSCLGLFTQCTTQGTTRLTSSPSDDVEADDVKTKKFARANWENLATDIARGRGEYLSSLAALLKVRPEAAPTFAALAQTHYRIHQEQGTLNPDIFVEGLRDEIIATPSM
jgi:hypothetical protein